MAAAAPVDWLARGRAQREHGRIVDALLCFQRAVRAAPGEAEPRLELGLTLRAVGRDRDAIALWREDATIASGNRAVGLALAQTLLAVGEPAAARIAVAQVLQRVPGEPRARVLEAVAGWLDGAPPLAPASSVADALADDPAMLVDPAIPAVLLALVAEAAVAQAESVALSAVFADAQRRDFSAAEHDALRRIARAATRLRLPSAPALARRYRELCAAAFRSAVALPWPERTAGTRLRIVALVEPQQDDPAIAATLAALPASDFDVRFAGWRGTPDTPQPYLALGGSADEQVRRLAAFDADAIVDLVGLEGPCGPVLAARPARAVLALDESGAPSIPPWCDRSYATGADLVAHLGRLHRDLPAAPAGFPDALAMAGLWQGAVRAHQGGERAAALAGYGRVLELQPRFAPAHFLRGVLEREGGDLAAAQDDFALALAIAPQYAEARVAAANAALAAGRPQDAAALCAAGADLGTPSVALLRCWGLAELALRHGDAAAALFARALAVDPAHGDTHYNHGVALQMRNDLAEAARAYQRALAFAPHLVAADFNLGVLFQQQGATDAAVAAYGTVLAQDPAHAAAYRNLGETLLAAGRIDAALANFRRFEASCPDALALAVQALEVLQHQGDLHGIDRYLDGLARQRFRAAGDAELCDALEQLLYLLLFFDVDPEVVFRYSTLYDAALRRLQGPPFMSRATRRAGRLRVGYLSADLRGHVMGKMILQEVVHHDRARFALHFYALNRERDEWTQRFERIADSFVTLAGASDHEAAARIRDDDLDLLVDLSTHTKGARPGILALKPARVLITHVASAGTVGLSTIDFKLTDRLADVPETARFQLETPLPVDGCVYPFRHVAPAADHPFRRESLGIASDAVLIGAFVTPLKLSRRCLALWREVLQRVPRTRIVFSPANPAWRESYVRLARAGGIDAQRLLFVPQGGTDARSQARYALIDFVLDPMPFGGVNGTLEALDMEVPVVTLVGTRHGERTSYSILANLGVMQTVAQTAAEYVDLAVRLASDRAFVGEVKAAIRAGLAGSRLTDAIGHARSVEAAYLRALAQRAPRALEESGATGA